MNDPNLASMPRSAAPGPGVADMSAMFDYDEAAMPMLWKPHRPARPAKSEGGKRFKLQPRSDGQHLSVAVPLVEPAELRLFCGEFQTNRFLRW